MVGRPTKSGGGVCVGTDITTGSAEQAVATKRSALRGSRRRSCALESRLGRQITDSTSTAAAIPTRNCHRTRGMRTRTAISHICFILASTKCNGVRGNARYDEKGTSVERRMPVRTCTHPGIEPCINLYHTRMHYLQMKCNVSPAHKSDHRSSGHHE